MKNMNFSLSLPPIPHRYSLQFDMVTLEDFGVYTCNATNYMGNSSAVIHLTGRPKPVR